MLVCMHSRPQCEIQKHCWGPSVDWRSNSHRFSCNDTDLNTIFLHPTNVFTLQLLVPRCYPAIWEWKNSALILCSTQLMPNYKNGVDTDIGFVMILHFVFGSEIDPQLQTSLDSFSFRHFWVNDPSTSSHPLKKKKHKRPNTSEKISTHWNTIFCDWFSSFNRVLYISSTNTCTSPVLIVPLCPAKSWWVKAPSSIYVTVSKPETRSQNEKIVLQQWL